MSTVKIEQAIIQVPSAGFWSEPATIKSVCEQLFNLLAAVAPTKVRKDAQKWSGDAIVQLDTVIKGKDFQPTLLLLHQYIRSTPEQQQGFSEEQVKALLKLLMPHSQVTDKDQNDRLVLEKRLQEYRDGVGEKATVSEVMAFVLRDVMFKVGDSADYLAMYRERYMYPKNHLNVLNDIDEHNAQVGLALDMICKTLVFAMTPPDLLKSDFEHYTAADGTSLMPAPGSCIKSMTETLNSIAKALLDIKKAKHSKKETVESLGALQGLVEFYLKDLTTQFSRKAAVANFFDDSILKSSSRRQNILDSWASAHLKESTAKADLFMDNMSEYMSKLTQDEAVLASVQTIIARYKQAKQTGEQNVIEQTISSARAELQKAYNSSLMIEIVALIADIRGQFSADSVPSTSINDISSRFKVSTGDELEKALEEAINELARIKELANQSSIPTDKFQLSETIQRAQYELSGSKLSLAEIKSIQELKEFFFNEILFCENMARFKESLVVFEKALNQDKRFSPEDRGLLKNYISTIGQLLNNHDALDFWSLINNPQNSPDQILEGISRIYSAPDFIRYDKLLSEMIAFQNPMDKLFEKLGKDDPLLTCFKDLKEGVASFTIRPVQHHPRYPLQFVTIKATIEKILKLAKSMGTDSLIYTQGSLDSAESVLQASKQATQQINLNKGIADSIIMAQHALLEAGSDKKAKKVIALKKLLELHLNSPLQDLSPNANPNAKYFRPYILTLLTEAYSDSFKVEAAHTLAETLGINLGDSSQISFEFNPALFSAPQLEERYKKTKDPLWLVLKSMQPVSPPTFSATAKMQTYIDLAQLFRTNKIGDEGKYKGALEMAKAAYKLAGEHPELLEQVNTAFSFKIDGLGHWIVAKQIEHENWEIIDGCPQQSVLYCSLLAKKELYGLNAEKKKVEALTSLLALNLNSPSQKESTTASYSESYIQTLLAEAYSNIFKLKPGNNELEVITKPYADALKIYKALGISIAPSAALVKEYKINCEQFDGHVLDALYGKDQNPLWLVLKSMKPIVPPEFIPGDKVAAYVELVKAIYDGKMGLAEDRKQEVALSLARLAYSVAKDDPDATQLAIKTFAPYREPSFDKNAQRVQSQFGDWLVSGLPVMKQYELIDELEYVTPHSDEAVIASIKRAKTEVRVGENDQDRKEIALKCLIKLIATDTSKASVKSYIQTLILEAYPECFASANGKVYIKPGLNYGAIYKAFGINLELNPSARLFEIDLDKLSLNGLVEIQKADKSNPLWTVLRALKPISAEYMATDKVSACIEVATAFKNKAFGARLKFEGALEVAELAYEVVKEKPDAMQALRAAFNTKSTLGKWIVNKYSKHSSKYQDAVKKKLEFNGLTGDLSITEVNGDSASSTESDTISQRASETTDLDQADIDVGDVLKENVIPAQDTTLTLDEDDDPFKGAFDDIPLTQQAVLTVDGDALISDAITVTTNAVAEQEVFAAADEEDQAVTPNVTDTQQVDLTADDEAFWAAGQDESAVDLGDPFKGDESLGAGIVVSPNIVPDDHQTAFVDGQGDPKAMEDLLLEEEQATVDKTDESTFRGIPEVPEPQNLKIQLQQMKLESQLQIGSPVEQVKTEGLAVALGAGTILETAVDIGTAQDNTAGVGVSVDDTANLVGPTKKQSSDPIVALGSGTNDDSTELQSKTPVSSDEYKKLEALVKKLCPSDAQNLMANWVNLELEQEKQLLHILQAVDKVIDKVKSASAFYKSSGDLKATKIINAFKAMSVDEQLGLAEYNTRSQVTSTANSKEAAFIRALGEQRAYLSIFETKEAASSALFRKEMDTCPKPTGPRSSIGGT